MDEHDAVADCGEPGGDALGTLGPADDEFTDIAGAECGACGIFLARCDHHADTRHPGM